MPVQRMTLGEFQGKLHGYREEFLQCKDVRHRWEVVEPYRREKKLVQRVLECQRCGTQRIDNYVVLGSQRLARQDRSGAVGQGGYGRPLVHDARCDRRVAPQQVVVLRAGQVGVHP